MTSQRLAAIHNGRVVPTPRAQGLIDALQLEQRGDGRRGATRGDRVAQASLSANRARAVRAVGYDFSRHQEWPTATKARQPASRKVARRCGPH